MIFGNIYNFLDLKNVENHQLLWAFFLFREKIPQNFRSGGGGVLFCTLCRRPRGGVLFGGGGLFGGVFYLGGGVMKTQQKFTIFTQNCTFLVHLKGTL